jgi:hypothetical protein
MSPGCSRKGIQNMQLPAGEPSFLDKAALHFIPLEKPEVWSTALSLRVLLVAVSHASKCWMSKTHQAFICSSTSRATYSHHQNNLPASSTSDQPQSDVFRLIRVAIVKLKSGLAAYKYLESTQPLYLSVTNSPPDSTRSPPTYSRCTPRSTSLPCSPQQ